MRDHEVGAAIAEHAHKARYCFFDEPLGMLICWYGGMGVNAFDVTTATEVAHWNFEGGPNGEPPEIEEVIADIEEDVATGEYLERY
jgi:hypothetical protein